MRVDALAIWAMIEANKSELKKPLQIALSYDEEVGCIGAPPMIDEMINKLPKASMVIVGEPSPHSNWTGCFGFYNTFSWERGSFINIR